MPLLRPLLSLLLLAFALAANAEKAPVLIGLDAEFGHRTSTSAQAVQQGIEIAIAEINAQGGVLDGRPLQLVTRDNRSITAMGVDNFRELATMPELVGVFGGKFSPIYIEVLPVAHELGLLLLDPWGSADPITDHDYRPSYSFRLSLKDAWAAPAMLNFAKRQHGATRVGLLLPNTAWGRSNLAALQRSADDAGVRIVGRHWYNWGDKTFTGPYQALRTAGAEVLILVANETEGAVLVREIAALPENQRLPIVSHWGVTGGRMFETTDAALQAVDFAVIQTFSFIGRDTPIARRVLAALHERYGIAAAERVPSPVGVAHAYDLTHLLARAIERAGSTDRRAVRDAMEHLGPYDGLVRHYERPFAPDRHDALSADALFFARYSADGVLIPIDRPARDDADRKR